METQVGIVNFKNLEMREIGLAKYLGNLVMNASTIVTVVVWLLPKKHEGAGTRSLAAMESGS
jgi:hypothetical protein